MDPLSLGLAAASFGANAAGLFGKRAEKRQAVNAANKQAKMQNRFAQQQWAYGEAMRERQQRQEEQLYEMRKKEYAFQKQLNYDVYKDFYEDSQLAFDQLVRDTRIKSLQSANKLNNLQSKSMASALNRGATGRRAGVRNSNSALWAGMEQRSRTDRLLFADQEMRKDIARGARDTDLRNQIAFNRVGPPPEALPQAPMPVMRPMQKQSNDLGLYAGLVKSAVGAVGTYNTLAGNNPASGGSDDGNKWGKVDPNYDSNNYEGGDFP